MATGCRDLVVLIDVTMSMKPCMEALKKNISFLIETLENQKDPNGETRFPNWRVMIAGYRDAVANPSNWFVQFPFTNDVSQLRANLSHPDMECKGGGDEPESLLDALYKLTVDMPQTGEQDEPDGLKWRLNLEPVLCRKVIVFFTDASYKPVTAIPPGKTVIDIVDKMENDRIKVICICPQAPCYEKLGGNSDQFEYTFYSETPYINLGNGDTPEAKRDSVDSVKKLEEVCGSNGESNQFKVICEIVARAATVIVK